MDAHEREMVADTRACAGVGSCADGASCRVSSLLLVSPTQSFLTFHVA